MCSDIVSNTCVLIWPLEYSHFEIIDLNLYNKRNNTWELGDMKFIFSCSISISHSFAALTREISSGTLEDKFHISARPCIILKIINLWNTPSICVFTKFSATLFSNVH